MWQAFKFDYGTGDVSPVSEPADSPDALAVDLDDDNFIFWNSDIPDDEDEQHKIAEELIKINNGRVLRVMLGVTINVQALGRSNGSCGRCACVVEANGRRYCETYVEIRRGVVIPIRCRGSC